MSTKIYGGMRLDTRMLGVFAARRAIDEATRDVRRRAFEDAVLGLYVGSRVTSAHEVISRLWRDPDSTPMPPVVKTFIDKDVDVSLDGAMTVAHSIMMNSRPEEKFLSPDSEFTVMFLEDFRHSDFVLLNVMASDEVTGAVATIEGVSEYAYWNNTDRPDHLSQEQWDARRDVWDAAVTGIGGTSTGRWKDVSVTFSPPLRTGLLDMHPS